jgi:hypothetical protein
MLHTGGRSGDAPSFRLLRHILICHKAADGSAEVLQRPSADAGLRHVGVGDDGGALRQGGAPLPREGVPVDEDDTELFEDYGLIVSEIQEKDLELTVVFHFWSGDGNLGEWNFEKDYDGFFRELLPLYDCEASIVKGVDETSQWAAIFRLQEGEVKRFYVEPVTYQVMLEKLAEINPEKYLPFLIDSMKHQIECIQERLEWTLDRLNPPYEAPSTTVEDIPF